MTLGVPLPDRGTVLLIAPSGSCESISLLRRVGQTLYGEQHSEIPRECLAPRHSRLRVRWLIAGKCYEQEALLLNIMSAVPVMTMTLCGKCQEIPTPKAALVKGALPLAYRWTRPEAPKVRTAALELSSTGVVFVSPEKMWKVCSWA